LNWSNSFELGMLQKGFSSELIVPLSQNLNYNDKLSRYKYTTPKHWQGHFHAVSHEIVSSREVENSRIELTQLPKKVDEKPNIALMRPSRSWIIQRSRPKVRYWTAMAISSAVRL
jgi:hypothetical protein